MSNKGNKKSILKFSCWICFLPLPVIKFKITAFNRTESLSTMAKQSLAARFFNIFRAESHHLLDSIEDPVKALEQQMRDLSNGVNKTEAAVAQAIGNVRMLEQDRMNDIARYSELGEKAQRGMAHAEKERAKGNAEEADRLEDLARALVTERVALGQDIRANSDSIEKQSVSVESMKKNLGDMKAQQKIAIRKKESLVARHVASQSQIEVQKTMKSISTIDTNSEMGRLEAKVRSNEAKALGMTEMQAATAEAQLSTLDDLDAMDAVEAEMAALKANPSSAKFQLTAVKSEAS